MAEAPISKRFCIIGAGACGLPVVKTFKERGIPFDCFESEDDIGGIWNPESPHAVFEATHLNTSKRLTRYTDFPMPAEYPQFLSRLQAHDYLRAYARHFELYDHISFRRTVETVVHRDGAWEVTVSGERQPRTYQGVIVANGHHWDPRRPVYPGTFTGETIHTHDLKTTDMLRGKRVLVVGAGNSGCDIAAEASHCASQVFHSMRRSYHFLPKFMFGRPIDVIIDLTARWPVPRFVLRRLYRLVLDMVVGRHERYGLPEPDHKLFEAHPSAAAAYLDRLGHGRITPKPDVKHLCGRAVEFQDGSRADIDLIVQATGYRVSIPFMNRDLLVDEDGRSRLFLNLCHREHDGLFAVGLVQPAEGSFWQLADYQAQLIASYIVASERDLRKAAWFRELRETSSPRLDHGVTYVDSERHRLEVQHYTYRTYIKRLLRKFGPMATEKLTVSGVLPVHDRPNGMTLSHTKASLPASAGMSV